MQKTKRILLFAITGILLVILSISIVQIFKIYREYAQESRQHQELLAYKPTASERKNSKNQKNRSVSKLKAHYPDTVGWITIDGTKIDYPFVQAKNNQTYLRQDMDLKYLVAGTVFMDYRNNPDFTDFATIIYGHQMKNNSMFGTMDDFRDEDFFIENSTGRIYLPDRTLKLEVLAELVVKLDDKKIYELEINSKKERQEFISYIQKNAELLRENSKFTIQDRFVLLSTCVYDFDGARMVLVTRIKNE